MFQSGPMKMNSMIRALGTANPALYVTQSEAYDFYVSHFNLAPEEHDLYRRLLLEGPVRGRYIGMARKEDACETDPDRLNDRFLTHARQTAAEAAAKALTAAGLSTTDLGGLVVNTCTGYVCPGLSSYLVEDLGAPHDLRTLDIVGMGCGAALPNLECATGWLVMDGQRPVLCVAVEICSATLFMGNEPGLVVSNSIFGDGAAAAVLAMPDEHDAPPQGPVRILGFESSVHPEHRHHLRYTQSGGRLRNHLDSRVPVIGARLAGQTLARLLTAHRLEQDDIAHWAVHAGGTAVLERVGQQLGIPEAALAPSIAIFHEYGNMSSPSVLFALQRVLATRQPSAGELGVLLSFGAGFSAFAALVEFTGAP